MPVLLPFVVTFSFGITFVIALLPFEDPTLTWDRRVDDLVSRLTLEEIANQTQAVYGDPTYTAVPRLNIRPYVWITECVHGEVKSNATAFPHSIGLSAAWSKELLYNVSHTVSTEVRARWNANSRIGQYQTNLGLSCFSPVINIARHPLWGRNQETYGECPYLSGSLVQHFVRGLQGDDQRYVRVNAGCKHFDVHGGPENIPVSRFSFNAKVSIRDWRMTFLPAFKMCVEAGTYSMMCSFNSINGVPACANAELLTNIARQEWGFKGYVVSDNAAVRDIQTLHHFTKSEEETAAKSIQAGCNLELGSHVFLKQVNALKLGMITEEEIRNNVKPLLYTRMRLGEFDPPSMNPYSSIDMSVVQSPEHRALAVKAAQMTFTLLKNIGNILPLKKKVRNLAIVGPFGNATEQLFGNYAPDVVPKFLTTVLQGLSKLATGTVGFASGCDDTKCAKYDTERQSEVESVVKGSDLVIVALGTGPAVEAEKRDREYLDLPGKQLDLLQDAVFYKDGDEIPVILLLFNAGPVDITWAKLTQRVHAIVECYFPAQATGEALYNTLTATSADAVPAGRLTMTWPADISQVPEITNYTMEGRTYRYYRGEPLYPFGYGLSYTSFLYSDLVVSPPSVKQGEHVSVKVTVENTGEYDGDEVIQVYMSWLNSPVPVPKLQLVGYSREHVPTGEQLSLSFTITAEQMSVWEDDTTGWAQVTGEMQVYAGGQQPDQRTQAPSNVLTTTFLVKS